MRTLILVALVTVACSDPGGGSVDAGPVTELPDGAPCPSGQQFCGGTTCINLTSVGNCGNCGVRCPASAPACVLRTGAYVCVP